MNHENLRSLCGLHEEGMIAREAYRDARRALIEAVVAGRLQLPPLKPLINAEANADEPTVPAPMHLGSASPEQASSGPRPVSRRGPLLAALILGTGLIVGGYLWSIRPVPPVPGTSLTPANDSIGGALQARLNAFLQQDVWTPEAMREVQDAWRSASDADRAVVRSSLAAQQIDSAAYSRLAQAQALAAVTNDPENVQTQQSLVTLAQTLGLSPERWATESARLVAEESQQSALAPEPPGAGESAAAPALPPPPETPPVPTLPPEPTVPSPMAEPVAEAVPETAAVAPPAEPLTEAEPAPAAEAAATAAADAEPVAPPTTPAPATPGAPPPAVAETPATTPPEAPVAAPTAPPPAAPVARPDAAPPATKAATAPVKARGTRCRAELAQSRKPFCRDPLPGGGATPTLAVLPAGEFSMGSSRPGEGPQRTVRLARAFAMAVQETSVEEYQAYCTATGKACPAQPWTGKDFPVVRVSWQDAMGYCEWLSGETGARYRLPTEAEWEYATRAGSRTRFPFGDELLPVHAQFVYQAAPESPLPRSDRRVNRNAFKLLHTVGNVREWVADVWADDYSGAATDGSARGGGGALRVVRGGSYRDSADALRSSARTALPAGTTDDQTGFRVLVEVAP
jgi:formylglycine-generating enzyme required for sulfatase activity